MELDVQRLKAVVLTQTQYLSDLDQPDLASLLEVAKENHRVQRILPFFGRLFHSNEWDQHILKIHTLEKYDNWMEISLGRVEQSPSRYAAFGYELRELFFQRHTPVQPAEQYDEAEEMVKLLEAWHNHLFRDEARYRKAQEKARAILEKKSFAQLLVPVKKEDKDNDLKQE